MSTPAPQSLPDQPSGDWKSLATSLAIHVIVLVALGLFWTSRTIGGGDERARPVEIVLATADSETEYLEQSDFQPVESAAEQTNSSLAEMLPASDNPPVDTSPLMAEAPPIDVPLPGMDSASMAQPDMRPGTGRNMQLTPEQLEMLAAEQAAFEARRPKGPPTTLNVFGSGDLTGRKFVFVIDRSKSMGGEGLNVLNAASDELGSAINSLQDYHQFQIVAYHHQTLTITRRALLNATGDSKSRVGDFIDNLAAFGGTEHEGALITALSMDPDVVVLLTDGGLPWLNESQLRRISRAAGGTQIHCVQFGSGPPQNRNNFMQELARQNSGTFRYVDVTGWNR